jgi:hypothetical protein
MASWADVEFNLLAAVRQRMAEALALAGTFPTVKRDGFEDAEAGRNPERTATEQGDANEA